MHPSRRATTPSSPPLETLNTRQVAKSLSHTAKFSSASLTSAGSKSDQRAALGAPVDVVFATPTRLLQHNEEGTLHLGDVKWVVVDEADTMILKARVCARTRPGVGGGAFLWRGRAPSVRLLTTCLAAFPPLPPPLGL